MRPAISVCMVSEARIKLCALSPELYVYTSQTLVLGFSYVYYYDYAEWRAVFENASVGSFVKPPRVIKSRDETRSQPPRPLNLHVFAQSTARSKFGDKCGVEVRMIVWRRASFCAVRIGLLLATGTLLALFSFSHYSLQNTDAHYSF